MPRSRTRHQPCSSARRERSDCRRTASAVKLVGFTYGTHAVTPVPPRASRSSRAWHRSINASTLPHPVRVGCLCTALEARTYAAARARASRVARGKSWVGHTGMGGGGGGRRARVNVLPDRAARGLGLRTVPVRSPPRGGRSGDLLCGERRAGGGAGEALALALLRLRCRAGAAYGPRGGCALNDVAQPEW
eukprot:scaffold76602_cov63-Phaeocystis_antarctica.AAC.1